MPSGSSLGYHCDQRDHRSQLKVKKTQTIQEAQKVSSSKKVSSGRRSYLVYCLVCASILLLCSGIAGVIIYAYTNNNEERITCFTQRQLNENDVVIQDGCTVINKKKISRMQERRLFMADIDRSQQEYIRRSKILPEVRTFWDTESPAYWVNMMTGIGSDTLPLQKVKDLHTVCEDRDISTGKQRVYYDSSEIRQGCPMYFEIVNRTLNKVTRIQNRYGDNIIDRIKERVYAPDSTWEPMWADPEEWTAANHANAPFNCSNVIGRAYNGSDLDDRYRCHSKLANDGNRFFDSSNVDVIRADDSDNAIIVTKGTESQRCSGDTVRVFDPLRYSVIYIILISHLYNRYELKNTNANDALDIKIDYTPRRISSLSTVDSLPCIHPDGVEFVNNYNFITLSPPPPSSPNIQEKLFKFLNYSSSITKVY